MCKRTASPGPYKSIQIMGTSNEAAAEAGEDAQSNDTPRSGVNPSAAALAPYLSANTTTAMMSSSTQAPKSTAFSVAQPQSTALDASTSLQQLLVNSSMTIPPTTTHLSLLQQQQVGNDGLPSAGIVASRQQGASALDASALLHQISSSTATASSTHSIPTLAGLRSINVMPQPFATASAVPLRLQSMASPNQLGQLQQPLAAAASAAVPLQFQSTRCIQHQAHQISQTPVAAPPIISPTLQQTALLEQFFSTQVQLTQPPALLQQLASSTTAASANNLNAPQAQDTSSQLVQQLIQDNMAKHQTINALLSSQLHAQNIATSTSQGNLIASNPGTTLFGQGQGTVPVPVVAGSSSTSIIGTSGRQYLSLPAEELQEQRWLQRYHELIQFQQVRVFVHSVHWSATIVCCISCSDTCHLPFLHDCPLDVAPYTIEIKMYGHCRVPHGFLENRKLSWWVMNQRSQRQLLKKGKSKRSWLTPDRISLLDAIGFDWNPTASKANRSRRGKSDQGSQP